jgi:SPX domain protein involved in polyphosphate accumulation/uncharacterized membrane protein YidH (DUF202 family)
MKFSELIKKSKFDEFNNNFIDYSTLKRTIRPGFSDSENQNFQQLLKNEISRFDSFANSKHVELIAKKEDLNIKDEKTCEDLKIELFNFSEFIRINIIGIKRIIRRYDKISGFKLEKDFHKILKTKKLEIKNVKFLITSINNEVSSMAKKIKRTEKYLIPQEEVVKLKLSIMKHLPETHYVKNAIKVDDSYINSVYLDDNNFTIYKTAADLSPKTFFIRFRWFSTDSNVINCELIENNESKVFFILQDLITRFLNGDDIWNEIKKINNEENHEIYLKIKKMITDLKLRPSLRTFYRRYIFENKEKTAKISLDSNIVMIKENKMDDENLRFWKRNDISDEWPFRNLPPSEIVRFTYSLLTITAECEMDWLDDVLSGSNIIKNNIFSKFVHGSAILYPFTHKMPIWLDRPEYDLNNSEVIHGKASENDSRTTSKITDESEIEYELSKISDERNNIVIPVRVEPKAFFANERTFLSWVQFAIFIGGIGTAMVGLGNEHAYVCGAMFIGIAAIFAFYSLYLFHYRASRIRSKDPGPYDTNLGPAVLVGIFILVMILSFIFKFPIKKNGLHPH